MEAGYHGNRVRPGQYGLPLVVPAKVEGRWNLRVADPAGEHSQEYYIKQTFQELAISLAVPGKSGTVREERLEGERIAFVLAGDEDYLRRYRYEGRVSGDTMEGTVRGEGSALRSEMKWRAMRSK